MIRELDRKDERPDTMTSKDRDKINEFSRLLVRRSEVDGRLKSREQILRLHDDAVDELALLDDDAEVQHSVGDVFLIDTAEKVTEAVENAQNELRREINEAGTELESITARLASLKSTLYAKFGNVRTPFRNW